MYPRIPWKLVVDPLGSAEHTLGTAIRVFLQGEVLISHCRHSTVFLHDTTCGDTVLNGSYSFQATDAYVVFFMAIAV
jgi:hypothetical protein